MSDAVNHPAHYNSGKIEVIEALEDWGLNFHRANAVKYIARAGRKNPDKEIEDLEKAIWYLRRNIELLKAELQKRNPVPPNEMPRAIRKCHHSYYMTHREGDKISCGGCNEVLSPRDHSLDQA